MNNKGRLTLGKRKKHKKRKNFRTFLFFRNVFPLRVHKITGNLGDNAKIGQKSNFLKLSVAILSQDEQRFFEGKVDELLSNPDSQKNIETDIDKAIYRVYGLLINEIQFIESQ